MPFPIIRGTIYQSWYILTIEEGFFSRFTLYKGGKRIGFFGLNSMKTKRKKAGKASGNEWKRIFKKLLNPVEIKRKMPFPKNRQKIDMRETNYLV